MGLLDFLAQPSTADFRGALRNIPVRKGGILPLTEYGDGSARLDWTAGVPGSIMEAFTAPARAYRGEIAPDQMIPEGLNFAGTVALGSAGVPRPRASVGMGGKPAEVSSHLDMSPEARMARAREMGFDTGQTWYHATPAEKIEEFKPELIGSHTDAGHLASGFYFADSPSEAAYYAPNVGSYYTRGKMWDAGGGGTWPEMFKQWAPMMDDVGLLGWRGDTLKSIRAIDGMVDNAKVSPLQDGEFSGYYAYMPHPEPSYEGHEIGSRGSRHNIPKTPDEAIENLRNRAYYELDGSDEFPGLNGIDTFTDFVRTGRLQDEVAKRLTEKGYSGIKYGSELVVFDPTNIRSVNAAFDPAKSSSANLLAANPETGAAPGLGLMAAAKQAEQPHEPPLMSILRAKGILP